MKTFIQEFRVYCINFSKAYGIFCKDAKIIDNVIQKKLYTNINYDDADEDDSGIWEAPLLQKFIYSKNNMIRPNRLYIDKRRWNGFSRIGVLQFSIFNRDDKTYFEVFQYGVAKKFRIRQNNLLMPCDLYMDVILHDYIHSSIEAPLMFSIHPCDSDIKSWYDVGDGMGHCNIRLDVPKIIFYDEKIKENVSVQFYFASTFSNVKRKKDKTFSYSLYAQQQACVFYWAKFTVLN